MAVHRVVESSKEFTGFPLICKSSIIHRNTRSSIQQQSPDIRRHSFEEFQCVQAGSRKPKNENLIKGVPAESPQTVTHRARAARDWVIQA
jgi:hypothetical protein